MKIGYLCLTYGITDANLKHITLKKANNENLLKIIQHNLKSLEKMIDYNIEHELSFFRLSSDLIPFGSSEVNTLNWEEVFKEDFERIGQKINEHEIRSSMHPGQYTVLNSPKEKVVENAVKDLDYHVRLLEALKQEQKSKIILHVGGVYGNKEEAINRFEESYQKLDQTIKDRLIIENDDKSYTIEEVLAIGKRNNIPVVYDNLHHALLPGDSEKGDAYYIKEAGKTWKEKDGKQKIHYSQTANNYKDGKHSKTIDLEIFSEFLKNIPDVDIMLEVKDKDFSAIKVKHFLDPKEDINNLEKAWENYRYSLLERDPESAQELKNLLEQADDYPVIEFYEKIDQTLEKEVQKENALEAAAKVWEALKKKASEKEAKKYASYIQSYKKGSYSLKALKNLLLRIAEGQDHQKIKRSYYFYF